MVICSSSICSIKSFALYVICSIRHLFYTSFALYSICSMTKHVFIGIPERNLTMKCGNFFWKIRKLQFSSVLQSPSWQRDCSIIRGVKKNLICGENYIYSTLNKQGGYQYWRCLEFRRENCSAVAKTFIEGKEILNFPEHRHLSDIT